MVEAESDRPPLLDIDDEGRPHIRAHRCTECGRTAFPPDPYGCERCGASSEELEPIWLPARGEIVAMAEVHRHHRPEPVTPFTVAGIRLDDGPVLKAVLDEPGDWTAVGARVQGVVDADGRLRFGQEAAPSSRSRS